MPILEDKKLEYIKIKVLIFSNPKIVLHNNIIGNLAYVLKMCIKIFMEFFTAVYNFRIDQINFKTAEIWKYIYTYICSFQKE